MGEREDTQETQYAVLMGKAKAAQREREAAWRKLNEKLASGGDPRAEVEEFLAKHKKATAALRDVLNVLKRRHTPSKVWMRYFNEFERIVRRPSL